ncbi:MAG: RsmB/NOP family class I SAM-dependent RNA methyltransferase [Candidatus Thermoplasmatota archaeon]
MTEANNILSLSNEIKYALDLIFIEGKYTSKAIYLTLKKRPQWIDSKRFLFSDTIYEIVRYWRLLWYILGTDDVLLHDKKTLRDILKIYTVYENKRGNNLIYNDTKQIPKRWINRLYRSDNIRVMRESIPDWLDDIGLKEIGEQWEPMIHSLNKKPLTYLRVNTLKIPCRDTLRGVLKREGVNTEPADIGRDSLLIKDRINPFRLPSFHKGFFEVQDAASQWVSEILEPEPGMTVIDACAGEGGKTLHLAALMKNKGKILALDHSIQRLKELKRRAKRAGVDNIEVRLIKNSKSIKRLRGRADRLLLDVPCSGLGTLRRNPDIKWKITLNDLDRVRGIQRDILERYHTLAKINGRIAYSVCSVLPSEGEKQIRDFLEKHDQFKLLKEEYIYPDTYNTDGFYVAIMERYK